MVMSGRGQLLGVATLPRQPLDRRLVALGRDQLARVGADRRQRIVVQLAAGDDGNGLVEQARERACQARLGLAALAQEADVLAGQDGVLDRRQDAVVIADDALEHRPLRRESRQQVGAHLLLDAARGVARFAQLAQRPRRLALRDGLSGCQEISVAHLADQPPIPRRSASVRGWHSRPPDHRVSCRPAWPARRSQPRRSDPARRPRRGR